MDKSALKAGINLGGWISQYPVYATQYFDTFITREDIRRIADWGMDHVRLPVDYPVLEQDSRPGVYLERGFDIIEHCLDWCAENHLETVLDLHKAPGFSFDSLDRNTLFGSPVLQERYLALWEEITRRFLGRMEESLAFELLNEIVLLDSAPWNSLARRAVERIRSVDGKRLIILGGNRYNAPDELHNLHIFEDENVLYTFHFYSPLVVTHQKAPWVPALVEYNREVVYPGEAPDLVEFLKAHPQHRDRLGQEAGVRLDREYLEHSLAPAVDFSRHITQPVYCGEFGTYEKVDLTTRLNWTRDLVALLNEHAIGHALWNYTALDFGMVDLAGKVVDQELVKIASQHF